MSTPIPQGAFHIVDYTPEHRGAFQTLNLAWIEEYFAVEELDRRTLADPEESILRPGGHIFVALRGSEPVGVCALLRNADGSFELAKMAVAPSARGRGIGRALAEAAIARARALGAPYIELLSNTSLEPAIRLYRALGFVEVPLPERTYARADIRMVLELERDGSAPSRK